MPASFFGGIHPSGWMGMALLMISLSVSSAHKGRGWISLGAANDDDPVAAMGRTDGGVVVLSQQTGGLTLTTLADGETVRSVFLPQLPPIGHCDRNLLTWGDGFLLMCTPRLTRILLRGDQQPSLRVFPGLTGYEHFVTGLSFAVAPSGATLIAATDGRRVFLWYSDTPVGEFRIEGMFDLVDQGEEGLVLLPSVAYWSSGFNVLTTVRKRLRTPNGSAPYAYSVQLSWRAENDRQWRQTMIGNTRQTANNLVTENALIPCPSHIWAAYVVDSELYLQAWPRSRGRWSTPRRVATCGPHLLTGTSSGGRSVVAWVGNCNRRTQSWGTLPLSSLFSPDQRRSWLNNDVYALDLCEGVSPTGSPVRLTGDLSYTNGLSVMLDTKGLHVLRTGRSKVGFELDSYGAREEIYYRWIDNWGNP